MRILPSWTGLLAVPLFLSTLMPAAQAAPDKLSVSQLFTDHAVLQRAAKVPVWGWDKPGQAVTVSFGEAKANAKANENGRWQVELNLEKAGTEPADLVVNGSSQVKSADVIVGEVWLASGQSNMEFPLKRAIGFEDEQKLNPMPSIRFWHQAYVTNAEPQETALGKWSVAAPDNMGAISGVGYFFVKKLAGELHTTVGLVHSHWGGTPAEAWTSIEGLSKDAEVKTGVDAILQRIKDMPGLLDAYSKEYATWEEANQRQDHATDAAVAKEFAEGPTDGGDWKPLAYGAKLEGTGLPETGVIWFRKTVTLNATERNWQALKMGPFTGFDKLYVNGKMVNETSPKTGGASSQRAYTLNGSQLKEGENIIALRVFAPVKITQFGADPSKIGPGWTKGDWMAKAEYALEPLSPEAQTGEPKAPAKLPDLNDSPTYLYNAMISPLIPMAMRGVIWYQGESNAGRAEQYRRVFPNMIQDWREKWGGQSFSFYFCQLANYQGKTAQPGDSGWAELREAQRQTLSLPNTGQAILIDIGEEGDIHPRNKKDAGERLARIALAKNYGKDVIYSGPTLKDAKFGGGKAVLTMGDIAGGLEAHKLPATYKKKSQDTADVPLVLGAPDSELQGFAICGADKKWFWANAKITGKDTIEVSSADVAEPTAVRYAWANNPTCNLYSSEGLPAGPFRTDDFPFTSVGLLK